MTATKLANKRAAKAPAAKRRAVKARALKKGVSRETSTKGATPKPAATRRAAKRASGGAAQKEDRARAEEAAALWELCEEHTGRVEALSRTIFCAMTGRARPDDVDPSTSIRRGPTVQSGLVPALYALYWRLSEAIDRSLFEYFDGLVREGAERPSTHERFVPGALCFAGVCLGRWSAVESYVRRTLGEPTALDHHRRLELEVCARRLIERHDDEDGQPFLRTQIQRWMRALERGGAEESLSSLAFLLRRRDRPTLRALDERLSTVVVNGATWQALVSVAQLALYELRDASLLPALVALAERGLGAHDDGTRTTVLRALAACGATSEVLARASAHDGHARGACVRCALAAAEIERAVSDASVAEAREALRATLRGKRLDPPEFGACTALLLALDERGVRGFDGLARRLLVKQASGEGVDRTLWCWLEARVFAPREAR